MRTVLVMNSGSLVDQAFADPSAITAGHIAAFDAADGSILKLDSATTADTPSSAFEFFQGDADLPRRTGILKKNLIYDVTYKAYEAPAKQVTTISTIPTGVKGNATVRLIDRTQGYYPEPALSYEVKIAVADTAAQIVDKFVARINGNSRSFVVASKSGSNLVLTAKDFGTSFFTAIQEGLEAATVTGTTAPSLGSGTFDQVRAIEQEHVYVRDGDYHTNSGLLGAPEARELFSATGENYNIYTMRHRNNMDKNINKGFEFHEVTICVATDVSGDLDAFFADFL